MQNGINQMKLKLYGNLIIACLCVLLGSVSSEVIPEFTIHSEFNEKILTPVKNGVSARAEQRAVLSGSQDNFTSNWQGLVWPELF